jgi:phenylalanine-4-hydroxylase
MNPMVQRSFSANEMDAWNIILKDHEKNREIQIVDIYHEGLKILNINSNKIPQLWEINNVLMDYTGFRGKYVTGLEDGNSFYSLLANRIFPIGNFVRDKKDLSYTPAPDMVHDLYGHIPFFINKKYADFCQKFGEIACKYLKYPEKLRQFERFFWFTIEFGLIKTPLGKRIFGAGIASSIGECEYALSNKPEILDFDLKVIINQEFRIDEMQKKLFILESKEQLYDCLEELEKNIK